MKRLVRITGAVCAVATSGAILQGITALAHVPRGQQVVVLPRVEIVAHAPRPAQASLPPAAGRRAGAKAG